MKIDTREQRELAFFFNEHKEGNLCTFCFVYMLNPSVAQKCKYHMADDEA
jgi:hypothetical protein